MSLALFSLMSFDKNTAYDFKEAWKEVIKFENDRLPKSAQEKVAEIYEMALRENNQLQITKSTIYRAKYELALNENGFPKAVRVLETEITRAEAPSKQVLEIVTAKLYHNYLQRNLYKIKQRTPLQLDDDKAPENWSVNIFAHKIRSLVSGAARNPEQTDFPLEEYKEIVNNFNKETIQFKPSLYDLIVDEAILILNTIESFEVQASYMFSLTEEKSLGNVDEFLGINFETKDTNSSVYLNLNLFQEVLDWNKSKNRKTAQFEIDLQRLAYVYRHLVHPEKDALYLAQLENMLEEYQGQPQYSMVLYHLSQYYFTQGNKVPVNTYHDNYIKAISYAEIIIQEHPKSEGARKITNIYNRMLRKSVNVVMERIVTIDDPILLAVQYQNIDKVFFKLIDLTDEEVKKYVDLNDRDARNKLLAKKGIRNWSTDLPTDKAHRRESAELDMEGLPNGNYVLISGTNAEFNGKESGVYFTFFQSTNIAFTYSTSKSGSEIRVMDRRTGAPLAGATVQLYENFYDRSARRNRTRALSKQSTNKDGIIDLPNKRERLIAEIDYKEDSNLFNQQIYAYWNDYHREDIDYVVFTDRAIYRPGQTLHFKILSLQKDRWSVPKLMEGSDLKIVLKDANGQEVSKLNQKTNSYGSASGSFVLPEGVLKGRMSIQVNGRHAQQLRVEEYKRPKFYVEIDSLSEVYQLGDEVSVQAIAKSFAGTAIDGADVSYRVYRQAYFPYYYWRRPVSGQNQMEIINGQLNTDSEGKVDIVFTAIPDLNLAKRDRPVYHYRVEVDITDINGETQSKSKTIIIGSLSRQIHMTIEREVNLKDEMTLDIKVKDHNGALQPSQGVLHIYKKAKQSKYYKRKYWNEVDSILIAESEYKTKFPDYKYKKESKGYDWDAMTKVREINFDTGESSSIDLKNIQESGSYLIRAIVLETNGDEIEQVTSFLVYDEEQDVYPNNKLVYSLVEKKDLQPGDSYRLKLATSADVLNLYYRVEKRTEEEQSKWLRLDKSSSINLPITEGDRGGFIVYYSYIKDNRYYNGTELVRVPWKNKELDISFTSIRNKVLPGAEEEIQIKIQGEKKDAVAAELLAGMYDASLDEFVEHSWVRKLYPEYRASVNENAVFFHQAQNTQFYFKNRNYNKFEYKGKARILPNLNYFNLIGYNSWAFEEQEHMSRSNMRMEKNAMPSAPEAAMDLSALPTKSIDAIAATSAGISTADNDEISIRGARNESTEYYIDGVRVGEGQSGDGGQEPKELKDIPVRKNLKETVFFFPTLKTDAEGNVILSYTMNEALTKWNLFAFAHDEDLRYGFASQEVVTQKDVMVFPNPPRFLRDNDKITLSAKVSNLSDKALTANVQLDLYDAVTTVKVDGKLDLTNKTQTVQIPKGGSTIVKWDLNIPNRELDALNYKVIAQAGKHTDGEENTLPVLTDRVLVTETMPFTVNPNSTKKVRFAKMAENTSNTLVHENFALEYTSNPAWYAVQALPYLMEYPYKCTEQVMNRYYANTLASYISNAHPRVKSIFDQWKREDSEALISNLEKNQELKSALLKETPWVLAAKSETEQKKNIALLFDLNKMANEKKQAIQTIRDRQLYNGGFPWFTGGRANRYITQNVLETIGHLVKLGVISLDDDANLRQIVQKGIVYIDKEIEKEEMLISNRERDNLGYLAAHYLYVRSFFKEIPHQGNTKRSFDYFLDQAERFAIKRGVYHTGMLSLALHRFDKANKAQELKASLLERAFEHEELGLYWNEGNGYNWYELPIERHALLLEAMTELGETTESIDKMKLWLLRNKHTNNWKTTKATSAAIYALLIENEKTGMSSWIIEDDATTFELAGKDLKFENQEAGTAYVKKSWAKSEISTDLTQLEVTNNNDHVGWGSMYWQYFEEMDKVESFEDTPLKLRKQLYKVILGDRGEELIPVTDPLEIGDKIMVRIELEVDRTMEYVHMKDMRASGLEPINVLSRYKWKHGLGYYESTGDLATDFFFDRLPKGSYVFEYPLRVQHAGQFSNGITTIQCMYAPEYTSHSNGVEISVAGK